MNAMQTFQRTDPATSVIGRRSPAQRLVLPAAALVVLAIAIVSVGVGSVAIPPLTALKIVIARLPFVNLAADWPTSMSSILLDIRLPRVVLVAITGAAL